MRNCFVYFKDNFFTPTEACWEEKEVAVLFLGGYCGGGSLTGPEGDQIYEGHPHVLT